MTLVSIVLIMTTNKINHYELYINTEYIFSFANVPFEIGNINRTVLQFKQFKRKRKLEKSYICIFIFQKWTLCMFISEI